jgi:hypothetical protein
MRQARALMQACLLGPGSEEEKNVRVRPMIDRYAALHRQQEEARLRFEEDLRGMLTPVQQGRFILFMEEFRQHLREAMAGAERP